MKLFALIGWIFAFVLLVLLTTQDKPTNQGVLRDELSRAWRARDYAQGESWACRQKVYALERTFSGCVCQDGGSP